MPDFSQYSQVFSRWTNPDKNNAADVTVLRMASKNILYTVAHSNAMNGLNYVYKMAIWKIMLILVDILIPVGIVVWGVFAILGAYKKNKRAVNSEDIAS